MSLVHEQLRQKSIACLGLYPEPSSNAMFNELVIPEESTPVSIQKMLKCLYELKLPSVTVKQVDAAEVGHLEFGKRTRQRLIVSTVSPDNITSRPGKQVHLRKPKYFGVYFRTSQTQNKYSSMCGQDLP